MHLAIYFFFLLTPCALALGAARFYRRWDDSIRPVLLFLEMLALSFVARVIAFGMCFCFPPIDAELFWDDFLLASVAIDCVQVVGLGLLQKLLPNVKSHWKDNAAGRHSYTGRICALIVVALVAAHFALSAGWAVVDSIEDEEQLIEILYFAVVAGTFLLVFFSGRVSHLWRLDYLRRESARSIETLKMANPPIVFLRSFEIDKHIFMGQSVDEFLCCNSAIEKDPIISLGNPDGALPTGGSIKILASNDRWKDVVVEILKVCKAVVLVEGLTEGLHWEIKNVKKYVSPDRFFVVTLPTVYRMRVWYQAHTFTILYHLLFHRKDVRHALGFVWKKFQTYLCQEGFVVPDDDPGGGKILLFGKNWQVEEVITLRRAKDAFRWISNRTRNAACQQSCNYAELSSKLAVCLADGNSGRKRPMRFRVVSISAFLLVAASVVACLLLYVSLKMMLSGE